MGPSEQLEELTRLRHRYFQRPLHKLLGNCLAAGFVLDGLGEPGLRYGNDERPLSR